MIDTNGQDALGVARLMMGLSTDPERDAIADGTIHVREPVGLDPLIQDWFDHFVSSPSARAIEGYARRAGITFQQACDELEDPNALAAEMGYEAYLNWLKSLKCPKCSTEPEDWIETEGRRKGRRLKKPKYVAEIVHCPGCREIAKLEREISEDERADGEPTGNRVDVLPNPDI